MPISFEITQLKVAGFRGLSDLAIDFEPRQPTYLIGPNNSGKSSVVAAIALALRGGGFHKFVPKQYDFYHAPAGLAVERFYVTLRFEPSSGHALPAVQGAGNPEYAHGVQVRGDYHRSGSSSHKRYLIDADGKPITISARTSLKGEKKAEFKDHRLGWTPVYARLDDIRDHMPDVWLLRPDNLHRALYDWRTGPLQLLARLLSQRFSETQWEFEYNGKTRSMPSSMEAAHRFAVEAVAAFPFWRDELKPRLDAALTSYLGRQSRLSLQISIQSVEEWIAQQLVAGFASDAGGAVTPLASMGDGWQSLVRLAALDVLRGYPETGKERVVLLFEEPETFLHPHLRRKLRNVLRDLAAAGWTIVATTHAPEYISLVQPQTVCRLRRAGGDVSKGVFLTSKSAQSTRIQEKLDERGNHELFFANKVVLCEGKDDVFALHTYFEKTDADVDGASVTLVDVGGVENMPDYVSILQDLAIPWCAVTDEDAEADGTVKEKTAEVRRKLEAIRGSEDICPLWRGSLETCLGVSPGHKARPWWQERHLVPKSIDKIKAEHPHYLSAAEQVRSWIG